MLSDRFCDALDAHRNRIKEDDIETRCSLNVDHGGILIGCSRHKGHSGLCRTRWGHEGAGVKFTWGRK